MFDQPHNHAISDCNPTQAIDALLQGSNVVVCTSTASGKSVCYTVPILEALAADPEACALFMFPTKALAQVGGCMHQRHTLNLLTAAVFCAHIDRNSMLALYSCHPGPVFVRHITPVFPHSQSCVYTHNMHVLLS